MSCIKTMYKTSDGTYFEELDRAELYQEHLDELAQSEQEYQKKLFELKCKNDPWLLKWAEHSSNNGETK